MEDKPSIYESEIANSIYVNDTFTLRRLLTRTTVDVLLEHGGQFLELATGLNHSESVKLLLEFVVIDPSYESNASLVNACKCGYLKIVKLLLKDSRVDPSNTPALELAAANNHCKVVLQLLNYPKYNPSWNDYSDALWNACLQANFKLICTFLNHPKIKPTRDNFERDWTEVENECSLEVQELLKEYLEKNEAKESQQKKIKI